jgi:ABC-type antimicrobial peptide transport system permease subunit
VIEKWLTTPGAEHGVAHILDSLMSLGDALLAMLLMLFLGAGGLLAVVQSLSKPNPPDRR